MKGAIFDVDGTLVDSVDFHARAWQEAFANFDYQIDFEDIRLQIGKGGDQLMPVFLSPEELRLTGDEIEKYRGEIFRGNYLDLVHPFPGVRDLFEKLIADGWKIALASSAKGDELQNYKDLCRINDLLDTETSADDADRSKPYPDIFQAALKRLGNLPPENCVVVGDSPYDAEAAGKAGIKAMGFLSGGFPEEDLRHSGCLEIYQGPEDLLRKVDQSLFGVVRG